MPKKIDQQLPVAQGNNAVATLSEAELYKNADEAKDSFGRDDIAIPRLVILQSNSPQVLKLENTHVKGAEPGMIYDAVGGELFDGESGVVILPIFFRRTYVEWILRENGGGFVADHGLKDGAELLATCNPDDKNRDILPNKNQLVNTLEYIVYKLTENGPSQCIITMTGTQNKKGRHWNANIMKPLGPGIPTPFYARAFRFKTVPESNEKGHWFGWNITFECRMVELPEKGYSWCDVSKFNKQCADFRKILGEGKIKFAPPPSDTGEVQDPEAL